MFQLLEMHTEISMTLGLFGFDSGMEWYVSTQRVGDFLYNLSYQEFIWQQQLRSRCVIEA